MEQSEPRRHLVLIAALQYADDLPMILCEIKTRLRGQLLGVGSCPAFGRIPEIRFRLWFYAGVQMLYIVGAGRFGSFGA